MDNATQGWIAGLVAAAVTLAFTAWWETRQHRRRQLDEAVAALGDAQIALWQAFIRAAAKGWKAEEIAPLTSAVGAAQLRVGALAGRRVVGIPSRFCAPARDGLRRTLSGLDDEWSAALRAVSQRSPMPAKVVGMEAALSVYDAVVQACQAEIATCNAWMHNPWRFFPGRDVRVWAQSDEAKTEPLI